MQTYAIYLKCIIIINSSCNVFYISQYLTIYWRIYFKFILKSINYQLGNLFIIPFKIMYRYKNDTKHLLL